MLLRLATLGPIGTIPVLGGFLASAAGLACAATLYSTLRAPMVFVACWGLLMALAMICVPRALAAGVAPRQIVLDRFAGVWLASAPALPLAGVAGSTLSTTSAALLVPLLIYHGLLALPLRFLGRRPTALPHLADDLIAGAVTLMLAIGVMSALIATTGATR
ncbi:phosphatidylglycerophosphatase A [Tropicimonas marinistellae]|uniref:phosphatidylglycerophosphatase A n=1 Tax=Tropicimonas marinistellae TaxID=1739787 RepID=UPI0008342A3A|nr:phosphatidylglycerophosphatase A [Tropicimonas marinistellae]